MQMATTEIVGLMIRPIVGLKRRIGPRPKQINILVTVVLQSVQYINNTPVIY